MSEILITTINARYIHASLGLRYLYANMAELQSKTTLLEYTINQRAEDIVEQLLQYPDVRIIGLGVYIWNVEISTEVIALIKILRPDIKLVLGGPEISFETTEQRLFELAHHVIIGQADIAFYELCSELLAGQKASKLISPLPLDLNAIAPPYEHYNEDDIKNRVLYVEASRGCPFKCEFCLSSLDKTATPFDLPLFLQQMQMLMDRGARHFKFVDRTFNLKAETSRQILQFFLEHIDKGLFLHFELIPDRLPAILCDLLPQFPDGSLQFEIGIQTFNQEVQDRISRKQRHQQTCDNLRWLREHTQAHIHADLIFGLPGEDLNSFGKGFDELFFLGPQEIQVGILKRLRGTPITRHSEAFDMRYMSTPPYRIVSNNTADFNTVQRVVRFARYWDLVANSGRFPEGLPLLLAEQPFDRFMQLSDWLFATTGQTHRIALPTLFELLYTALTTVFNMDESTVFNALTADFQHNKLKGRPKFHNKAKEQNSDNKACGTVRQQRHKTA